MHRTIALAVVAVFALGMFAGCTQRIGDFTLISTKNVDIGGKYKKMARHNGKDTKHVILGIPLGTPDLKQAVDNCIEAGNGELITNAVLEYNWWTAIVYGQMTYSVVGDVWGKADMSNLLTPDDEVFELRAGDEGFQLVSVTDPSVAIKVDYLASWY